MYSYHAINTLRVVIVYPNFYHVTKRTMVQVTMFPPSKYSIVKMTMFRPRVELLKLIDIGFISTKIKCQLLIYGDKPREISSCVN